MTQTNLSPYFITGLTDSDGCFTFGLTKSKSGGVSCNFTYQITQSYQSHSTCQAVYDSFGVGKLVKEKQTFEGKQFECSKYTVTTKKDLSQTIIPHFDEYPLFGQKLFNFCCFKLAFQRYFSKKKRNLEDYLYILELMYRGDNSQRRNSKQDWIDFLQAKEPLVDIKALMKTIAHEVDVELQALLTTFQQKIPTDLDPNYVSGLTQGDGCFSIGFCFDPFRFKTVFVISCQGSDELLCNKLKQFFGFGYVTPRTTKNCVNFQIQKRECLTKLIEHFDDYPLIGLKLEHFKTFKEAIHLRNQKKRLDHQDYLKILRLVYPMNQERKYSLEKCEEILEQKFKNSAAARKKLQADCKTRTSSPPSPSG